MMSKISEELILIKKELELEKKELKEKEQMQIEYLDLSKKLDEVLEKIYERKKSKYYIG